MNTKSTMDRSGLATCRDIEAFACGPIYPVLEQEQAYFLSYETLFRSRQYKWPRDPLHNWSRIWEYPYVFHHLGGILHPETMPGQRIVDVGSGVTFFPFALARRFGAEIVCTDIDGVTEQDLLRAAACVPHRPGSVTFRRTNGTTLPFKDASVDAVYCISVLEHIERPENLVTEIARILRPGGPFILTIDIALEGDGEIKPDAYVCLVREIADRFDYIAPDVTVHPASLLTSENSHYPLYPSKGTYRFRQLVKSALGLRRKRRPRLAVQGLVLRKKTLPNPCAS